MKYTINIEQNIVHHPSDGAKWISTECLSGQTESFEDAQVFMNLAIGIFPDSKITIAASSGTTIEEEE